MAEVPVDLEQKLLQALNSEDVIEDTGVFAESLGIDALALVGTMKSLLAHDMILSQVPHAACQLLAM